MSSDKRGRLVMGWMISKYLKKTKIIRIKNKVNELIYLPTETKGVLWKNSNALIGNAGLNSLNDTSSFKVNINKQDDNNFKIDNEIKKYKYHLYKLVLLSNGGTLTLEAKNGVHIKTNTAVILVVHFISSTLRFNVNLDIYLNNQKIISINDAHGDDVSPHNNKYVYYNVWWLDLQQIYNIEDLVFTAKSRGSSSSISYGELSISCRKEIDTDVGYNNVDVLFYEQY